MRKGRILLADDDPKVQRAVVRVAEQAGYELLQAFRGTEVERLARDVRPDLIVLDVTFPDADGRDVLARLKANSATRHIPVLIWSGGNAESVRPITIGLGAEDYVEKADAGTLLAKIERLLFRIRGERLAESF